MIDCARFSSFSNSRIRWHHATKQNTMGTVEIMPFQRSRSSVLPQVLWRARRCVVCTQFLIFPIYLCLLSHTHSLLHSPNLKNSFIFSTLSRLSLLSGARVFKRAAQPHSVEYSRTSVNEFVADTRIYKRSVFAFDC